MDIIRPLNNFARLKIILLIFFTILSPGFSVAGGGPSKEVDDDKPVISRPVERSIPVVPAAAGGAGGGTSAYTHGETAADARLIRYGTIKYSWETLPSGSPVVGSGPVAAPISAVGSARRLSGAPASVWNNWGDNVKNASIFPYLLEKVEPTAFEYFVKTWYKSSCAIVHYASDGAHIIGTGSYIDDNKVATARHCFEPFAIENLYVRFLHYKANFEGIEADFIDVPVLLKAVANGGLDAGYLFLKPIEESEARVYTRILPVTRDPAFDDDFATLPIGQYAIFHFAGGVHQISTGDVPSPPPGTAFIHNNIPIEAGDGASGATIIRSTGLTDVQAYGISIYRMIESGALGLTVARRVIPFAKFERPRWIDSISAPYGQSVYWIVAQTIPTEDGYEYLRWQVKYALEGKGNSSRPRNHIYDVTMEGHCNNHIIPRTDLWFLWMYVFDNNEEAEAELGRSNYARLKTLVQRTIKSKYTSVRVDPRRIESEINSLFEDYRGKYQIIQTYLQRLCPIWFSEEGVRDSSAQRSTGFAWSAWNLFKGWDEPHRDDDPTNTPDAIHGRSEKVRPAGFNKDLWGLLKDTRGGLFYRIQVLKEKSRIGLPDIRILDDLISSLRALDGLWNSPRYSSRRVIHPFNPAEWILLSTGKYIVKPT